MDLSVAQLVAVWALPVLLAIAFHEVAHGWVARAFGDPTAARAGRLTLNPLRHVDPVGTLLVPAVMLLLTPFVFGWAKPVPVDWRNLHRPRRDMVWVAAAGPGANLVMALAWGLLARAVLVTPEASPWIAMPLLLMGIAGVFINTILLVLNLLPLPPLDGGRVVTGLLPAPWAVKFARIEPYGIIILVLLLLSGALQWLIAPAFYWVLALLSGVTGLGAGQYLDLLRSLMGG